MKITIITATYNRENKLPILYNSLKTNYQTFKDFEWIIMDDGSSDNTKKLVQSWIKEVDFKINYHYQNNQGKMSAINNGMKYATGEIVMEIDSDDYLVYDALKTVNNDYLNLNDDQVYGIIYRRVLGKKDNRIDKSICDKVVRLFDIHNRYGFDFDMNLTFKTMVRKNYSYILEKNEKFVTEARMYYKIDQDYKGLLVKEKELVVGEYFDDGYSKNISKTFKKYPYGYFEYFKECLGYINKATTFKKRLYFIKHYILFSYLTQKTMLECIKEAKGIHKFFVILLVIPGYIKSKKI